MAEFTEDLPQYNLTVAELKMLHEDAVAAKSLAYCPYSKFQVGCALLLHPDSLSPNVVSRSIKGANIENASYPVGTCAERVALGTAICHYGLTGPQIKAVGVAANLEIPTSPCGACRQFMREFLSVETPVIMFGIGKQWTVKTMGELLPDSFGPAHLLMAAAAAEKKA